MARKSLKVKARFALILVVLVPSLLSVAATGFYGLRSERNAASSLYNDHVHTAQTATNLGVNIEDAYADSLELLLDRGNSVQTQKLTTALTTNIATNIYVGIAAMRSEIKGDPGETTQLNYLSNAWALLQQLRANGALSSTSTASTATKVQRLTSIFNPMTSATKTIVNIEATQASTSYLNALNSYSASVRLMLLVLILGLLVATGLVISLIRSVLKRTLSYSAFASAVSEGDYSKSLSPRGSDEIAQLGKTLQQMALRRQSEDRYNIAKLDFTDTLQVSESEQEAHELLKRYLERSVANSTVTILNRNNSADRLEAVTELPEGSPLLHSLEGAEPRSCLAVRAARRHGKDFEDSDPLLACSVCSACPGLSMCMPFIVGGEVIGSVLTNHEEAMTEDEYHSIREAVLQAAPVLGNLRNLAIAELRSSTDALTGLPNRRAIEDTLKRMVAQSSRTNTPLAALMCDLDHFKHINDQFGHGSGDDVLAAVGAALAASVRSSDFVGRYGGEEFLILLPGTGVDGAVHIAEAIRSAIADIRVPAVSQNVTLSVGVAVLPDHGVDASSLSQAADRALYAAKKAGRNRVEVFGMKSTSGTPNLEVVAENGIIEARSQTR